MSKEVYDSQARWKVFANTFRAFWDYRELIQLLVKRDIAVRLRYTLFGFLYAPFNALITSVMPIRNNGRVMKYGEVNSVIDAYLNA